MAAVRRYSLTLVRQMVTELEAWIEQTDETLSALEERSPNSERIDVLMNRLDALRDACEVLGGIDE